MEEHQAPNGGDTTSVADAPSTALKWLSTKWLWYSILCALCWGAWALCSKVATRKISEWDMQFLFILGTIPVALALVAARRGRFDHSALGIFYSVTNGLLATVGGIAMFAAFRSGGNTSAVAMMSALYPMVTVLLAFVVLRERLTVIQVLGLLFAVAAILCFA